MIKRFVKLSVDPAKLAEFKANFAIAKPQILSVSGCRHLELLQVTDEPNLFFTFSIWDSEHHLEEYKNTTIYFRAWETVKPLLNAEPLAWSTKHAG